MKRFSIVGLLLFALILGTQGTAFAILKGEPDIGRHPYVGLVTDGQYFCSGAAISPTVFITAAHCFDTLEKDVFVTFNESALDGGFVTGTWYPDPEFCTGCAGGLVGFTTHDVAVVILDQPLTLASYAALPTQGLVDTLSMRTNVTSVGYGAQDRGKKKDEGACCTRQVVTSELVQSESALSDEFIKLNASKGGTCFGDSGGPNFLRNTTTILAINSFVTNGNCAGVTYSYRIDTPEALAFITSIIDQYDN